MAAIERHAGLLRDLASKLRCRNLEQTVAFKDAFNAHQGLLNLTEKLRQQTLDQDKVGRPTRENLSYMHAANCELRISCITRCCCIFHWESYWRSQFFLTQQRPNRYFRLHPPTKTRQIQADIHYLRACLLATLRWLRVHVWYQYLVQLQQGVFC